MLIPLISTILPTFTLFGTNTFFEFTDRQIASTVQYIDRGKSGIYDFLKNGVAKGEIEALVDINGTVVKSSETRKNTGTNTNYADTTKDPKKYKDKIETPDDVIKFLENMGWGSTQIIALYANVKTESGFDPLATNGTHWGITQWSYGRYANMSNWCNQNGYDPKTLDGQIRYTWVEIQDGYYQQFMQDSTRMSNVPSQAKVGAAKNFWETKDYIEATKNYALCYEVGITYSAASGIQGWEDRVAYANEAHDKYYGGK